MKVTVAAVIGVSGLLILRSFADPDEDQPACPIEANAKFVLKIHNRHYANGADDAAVKKALQDQLNLSSAHYAKGTRLHFRHRTNGVSDVMLKPSQESAKIDIKTDKVVVSAAAKESETDLTLIQPHVTQQVASSNKADITKILDLLAP